MDLGFHVSHHGRWTVVAVRGEVDVATVPRLREQLIELVSRGENHLVLDLDAVDFLDSTGLGVLIGALKRVRTADGDLSLVCTHARILKVLEITGLTRVFTVHSTVEAAVAV